MKRVAHEIEGLWKIVQAWDESALKKQYSDYKRNHPNSQMDYNHFKEVRNRSEVGVAGEGGKQQRVKAGAAPIDKSNLTHHLKNGSFSVLTAENPHAQKTSPEENKKRTAALAEDLKKMGAVYHRGTGHFMGNDENVFMVHHNDKIAPEHLEELGKKYGQHSVIHSTAGHNHLKPLWDKYKGDEMKGQGHVTGPHLKNVYTKFPGAEKVKMRLSNEEKSKFHGDHYFTFAHPEGDESHVRLNFDSQK